MSAISGFPCPNKITCPGSDDPLGNLSSEDYDTPYFLALAYPKFWRDSCCNYVCLSTISQEDADLCARNIEVLANLGYCSPVIMSDGTVECGVPTGCPDCDPPLPEIYWNDPQCCLSFCENGSSFWSCVPAHTASAASIEEANAIALSLACQASISTRFCLDPLNHPCCLNVEYEQIVNITGGTAPFVWSIASGTMPTGLTLESNSPDFRSMKITGTPTSGALSSVVFQVVDAAGNVSQSTMEISIAELGPASLPDGVPSVAYSQQLTADYVPAGATVEFTLESGSLPPGLALSSDGLISGTPLGAVSSTFTVKITFT